MLGKKEKKTHLWLIPACLKRVILSSESEFLFPLPARPAFHLFFGLWRRSSEFLFHSSHLLLLDFEFFFFLPPSLLCKPPTFFAVAAAAADGEEGERAR